jgi:hypothetical protein
MLGRYKPDCDEDGYYKPRQCHENYCWCVDRFNQVIEGSKKEAWRVNCRKYTINLIGIKPPEKCKENFDISREHPLLVFFW